MLKLKLLALIIVLACQFSIAQTDGDQLFNEDILHEIYIEGPTLTAMETRFFDELFTGNYTYFLSKVTIDGVVIDSVGVRMKGGSSILDSKKPLKLDFNTFKAGQEFDGVKKMNLHNFNIDSSFQRELSSYDVMRTAGLKAPRTAVAQVYLNNQLQGVYGLVEQIDKNFLRNYFANDEGTLVKSGQRGVDLKSDTGSVSIYSDLKQFVNTTPNSILADTIEKVMDVEGFFKQLILQNIISTADNLFQYENNFYLYQEQKSQIKYFIPWDFNLSFLPWRNAPISSTPQNAMAIKLLEIPKYQQLYFQLACEMLDYNFTEERLFPLLDKRKNLIRDAVENDPYVNFSIADFDAKNEVIKTWIKTRSADLKNQLQMFSCQPLDNVGFQTVSINEIMASSDSLSGIADAAGDYPDWIELYNNTTDDVLLDGWYLSNDKDFKKHWKFPEGTTIEAGAYLTVWADRDVEEDGLHTDFKLSKNGGAVYLSRENLEVVDSIIFSTQNTNIAYARIPNGTGDFVFQNATFRADNGGCNECGGELYFLNEGQDYNLCLGDDIFFEVDANCDAFYQWQLSTNSVTWLDIPGGSADFSGSNSPLIRFEESGFQYINACFRCVIIDSCGEVTSQSLKVLPTFVENRNLQICENEPIIFDGDTLTKSGRYEAVYQDVDGCDSAIILDLVVLESSFLEIDTIVQVGELFEGILIENDTTLQKDLIAQNGCDSIVLIRITAETSSVKNQIHGLSIELFPNPSNGQLFLKSKISLPDAGEITFVNAYGQQILNRQISVNSRMQEFDIDRLTNGIYFVLIKFENQETLIKKLVVEH